MKRGRIADHRRDDVTVRIEGADISHRHRLFAGAEPCLRDDASAHPTLQPDVVQAGTQQVSVDREEVVLCQRCNDFSALRVSIEPSSEILDELRICGPVEVFRGVERWVSLHGRKLGEAPRRRY